MSENILMYISKTKHYSKTQNQKDFVLENKIDVKNTRKWFESNSM